MVETVHVINLDKREDRLLCIAKEAKAQGFAIMLWNGIDAPRRVDTKKAICLSHKKIVAFAKANKLPYILIAEDDLFFYGHENNAFKYFMDNIPGDYDLYCATIYNGEVDEENRIKNGMSGTMTLYMVNQRFYDVILNDVADDSHIDRSLGQLAHKYRYFVPPLLVAGQRQGYSDNLKSKTSDYEVYMKDRKIFGRD